jgi:hypothetical protein
VKEGMSFTFLTERNEIIMLVNIKWNKQVFPLDFDPADGVEIFKSQVYSLTGVPMER